MKYIVIAKVTGTRREDYELVAVSETLYGCTDCGAVVFGEVRDYDSLNTYDGRETHTQRCPNRDDQ